MMKAKQIATNRIKDKINEEIGRCRAERDKINDYGIDRSILNYEESIWGEILKYMNDTIY